MNEDLVKTIKQIQEIVNEVEKKMDSFFIELHKQNSDAIDEIVISMLENEVE